MRKRRHKRVIKRLETEFSANGLTFRGVSSDLSRCGLFVRTNKPFPEDTVVDLTIQLPGDTVSRIKGSVRRSIKIGQMAVKNGMGMEIVEVDHNYVNFLNTILPDDEQAHHIEHDNPEAVPPVTKSVPAASPKPVQDPGPKTGQDAKDEELDSMLSSLFSKRENK